MSLRQKVKLTEGLVDGASLALGWRQSRAEEGTQVHTLVGGQVPTQTSLATTETSLATTTETSLALTETALATSCPATMVVIVSPCEAERARLAASLPPNVTVLQAPSIQHAEEALRALPDDGDLGYRLLDDQRTVVFGAGSVRLTPLEYSLLRVLASEPGRVFSFVDLSRAVWSTGFVGDGAQVRAVLKRLRRKLGDAGAPIHVETVRAAGLRLTRPPAA